MPKLLRPLVKLNIKTPTYPLTPAVALLGPKGLLVGRCCQQRWRTIWAQQIFNETYRKARIMGAKK
jgi:xanthosine utilization system XapX-like protein